LRSNSIGYEDFNSLQVKNLSKYLRNKTLELKFRSTNEECLQDSDSENDEFTFREGTLIGLRQRVFDNLNFTIKNQIVIWEAQYGCRQVDFNETYVCSLAYSTLHTDWKILEGILNLLLFYIFKFNKNEEVAMNAFELRKGMDSMPEYKIALQKHIPDLVLDLDDYMIIWLEAEWLINPKIKILQTVNIINKYINTHKGFWIYECQGDNDNLECLPEITGLIRGLHPVIMIAIPYKPGKTLAYRDWAQDSLDEDSKSSNINHFDSKENHNVFH
jgi:hypothetical protein